MRNAIMVGERVYLRPPEVSDAAVFAQATVDERTALSKRGRIPFSPMQFMREARGEASSAPPSFISFVVARIGDDRVLGNVLLLDVDWINRTAETAAYRVGEDVRGQGYGTEAKMLLLEYAFDRIHLHALHAWVWSSNTRSQAALRKQGYRPAGRYHWSDLKNGAYVDHLILDVLRDEWVAARDIWRTSAAARRADEAPTP